LPPQPTRFVAPANSIPVPSSSHLCTLSVSTFSSPASPFNFELSTVNLLSLTPFLATLTSCAQLTENSATLSPLPLLQGASGITPLFATLTKKHPGGWVPPSRYFPHFAPVLPCKGGHQAIQPSFRIETEAMDPARNHWYIACHTEGLSSSFSASPAVRAGSR